MAPGEPPGQSGNGLEARQKWIGNTSQVNTEDFVRSVAMVDLGTGRCTGTLVAADKILTSAHCLCKGVQSGRVWFANANGNSPIENQSPPDPNWEEWPITSYAFPSDANVCGTAYVTSSDDDPDFYAAWDIAVLTIGTSPQHNRLPPFPPVKVFLGNNKIAFEFGRLVPFERDPSSYSGNVDHTPYYQAVGYGRNVATLDEGGDDCLGCTIRRWAGLIQVSFDADYCTTLVPEWDCYNTPRWRAKSISKGNTAEFARGDSGGPLVFLDTNNGSRVIAGTGSGYWHNPLRDDKDRLLRWSQTGVNADFLWEAIGGLPLTETLASLKTHVAVFVKGGASIGDRAKVVSVKNGVETGADIIAAGMLSSNRIGGDAIAGNVQVRGSVQLADRCNVGSVMATSSILRGQQVIAGSIVQAEYMRFEDFSVAAPPLPTTGLRNYTIESGQTLGLTGGPVFSFGDVTVRGGGTLVVQRGLYKFKSLTLNAGAIVHRVDADDNAKTWIFIYKSGYVDLQGKLLANDGTLFVGTPFATDIFLSNQFDATLVAPNAMVNADLSGNHASLVGSIFSKDLVFHQGAVLGFVPFTANWVPVCSSTGCT